METHVSSHFGAMNNRLQGGVRTIVQEMSALIFLLEKLNCVALARAEKQYTSTTADFPERRWWSRPKFERDLRASFTVTGETRETPKHNLRTFKWVLHTILSLRSDRLV